MNDELDWEIANYRALAPDHQARVRADAVRRAHALRHEAFRAMFRALALFNGELSPFAGGRRREGL